MTTEEALSLIDGILANFSGTRADHAKIQEALKVVSDAVNNSKK